MCKRLLVLFFLLFAYNPTISQDIKGKILELIDNKEVPIIGANIIWSDNSGGTTSDMEGNFILYNPNNLKNYIVSYVGYQNDTLSVNSINPKIFLSIGLILIIFSIIIFPGPCNGMNFLICISPTNWYEEMSISICSMITGIILLVIGMVQQQETKAKAALFLSIVFLVSGFLSDGLGFLLSPISLILANKSLKITNASPGHPDHGIARVAQIISWFMAALVLLFFFIILLIG